MITRSLAALACLAGVAAFSSFGVAQSPAGSAKLPERAVRRDIPITNAIRRAYAAGTRDSTGRPGRNYWQLRTDYTISARLDPATSRLTGRETIVLQNNSSDALSSIVMRLDQNMFLFNVPRGAPWVPAELTDGMGITRIAVNGQPVNIAAGGRGGGRGRGGAAPATENSATGVATSTRATINLVTPIPAHGRATMEVEWSHRVPGGPGQNHRMTQRWADTLYQPTQWYPRVAVYDDLRGWDPELYLGPSEFYNNFGKFDVSIEVPAGWIVSGTGVLQNPEQVLTTVARERLSHVLESDAIATIVGAGEAGTLRSAQGDTRGVTWHFVADTVNDFAWATAKNFVWQATRATIPGKGPVPVNMYFLPGDAPSYANAGALARHALEFYSKLWFPYQFPQLTLQDGPSAGMEYPMVINSNQGAADHETGHQWWPMTVSNNETWYGWMDEGFNQYMNILSANDRNGNPPNANLDGPGQSYGRTSGDENEPAMMWNANYAGPARYSFQTYSKTPLMLSMLGGVAGDSAVQRAQSDWAKTWLFKHPSPWDYMFFMSHALKQDLGWFWYSWLFTTESVDGSIQKVTTAGARTTVTVRQDGQMPSPVVLKVQFEPKGAAIRPMPNSRMADSATAIVTYPVDVWFAGSRTYDAVLSFGARRIEKVTLDPFCRFPDRDPSDNTWPRAAAPTAPTAQSLQRPAGRGGGGGGRGGAACGG